MARLLYQHQQDMDFIHVSTIWTRLATVYAAGPGGGTQQQQPLLPLGDPRCVQFVGDLVRLTVQHLHRFGQQAVANVAWAISNTEFGLQQHGALTQALLDEWCSRVCILLVQLRAADVSNICTAIGRLEELYAYCDPRFEQAFFAGVLANEELLATLDTPTLNNLLFGLSRARARGRVRLDYSTRGALIRATLAVVGRGEADPGGGPRSWEAAQLLTNLAKLQVCVPKQAQAVLVAEALLACSGEYAALEAWRFGSVVALLNAFLRVAPSTLKAHDLSPLFAHIDARLREGSAKQLAAVAYCSRELGRTPGRAFWREVFSRFPPEAMDAAGEGGAADALMLHYVCWQSARAGIVPPKHFLRAYLRLVPPWLRRHATAVQLLQVVETLRSLKWVPRHDFRRMLHSALARKSTFTRLHALEGKLRAAAHWVRDGCQQEGSGTVSAGAGSRSGSGATSSSSSTSSPSASSPPRAAGLGANGWSYGSDGSSSGGTSSSGGAGGLALSRPPVREAHARQRLWPVGAGSHPTAPRLRTDDSSAGASSGSNGHVRSNGHSAGAGGGGVGDAARQAPLPASDEPLAAQRPRLTSWVPRGLDPDAEQQLLHAQAQLQAATAAPV